MYRANATLGRAVAGVCGAIGQTIVGYSRGGCLAAVGIGFIGALLGMWLGRTLELPTMFTLRFGGTAFPIVWSILGSAIFVGVISLVKRRRVF